ncbi:hypothetical protein ACHAWF_002259 [Thalassiosira exigua]
MVLTEEQRKRIEENRRRALEIKRKRQQETEKNTCPFEAGGFVAGGAPATEQSDKKRKTNSSDNGETGGGTASGKSEDGEKTTTRHPHVEDASHDDESSLEDFEYDASAYISQTEAMRLYCVPMGTLAVCSYIEKQNPHKSGWSKMKLYLRSEVRRRGRKRFGGKEGLIRERDKRKKKRYERDLLEMKDVFR